MIQSHLTVHCNTVQQALHWEVPGFKRGPGHLRTNWRRTVNKDLLRMGITWEEAEVAAQNRSEWSQSVAQCIHLDVGWIKVKVMSYYFTNNWQNTQNVPSAFPRPLYDVRQCGQTLQGVSESLPACTGDWPVHSVNCPSRSWRGSAWSPSARCPECSCAQWGNMTWSASLWTEHHTVNKKIHTIVLFYHNFYYRKKNYQKY